MKKFITLALLVLLVVAIAACTNNNEPAAPGNDTEQNNDATDPAQPDPDPVPPRRTLVMGTSAGFFPFEFIADHGQGVIGQYAGIDVSLVARIAEELDVDIVIQDQEFAGLIVALQNRSIDFIAAGMTIRPDRAEVVNFSVPYYNAGQYVIVQQGNTAINAISDLEGLIVGVQLGTTGDMAITDGQADGVVSFQDIARFNQPAHGILDLISGSIDAFVVDAPVARAFLATYPGDLRIFSDPNGFFGPEQFGMAFHQDDTELLAEFNAVLTRLIAEGYVDYLYNYYMTYHVAPVE